MSWQRSPSNGALTVWFNRDESRSRSEATGPEVRYAEEGGTRWISCLDPDGGGTWLGVNEFGVCVALLNFYDGTPPVPGNGKRFTSRGLLVTDALCEFKNAGHAGPWLKSRIESHAYRPFILVTLDPGGEEAWRWEADHLETIPTESPITTSSFSTREVVAERRETYLSMGGGEDFHRWHDPERPAFSALMSRDDAHTVSLSRIEIIPGDSIRYFYATRPDWVWSEPTLLTA